jgi:hypothetical protein
MFEGFERLIVDTSEGAVLVRRAGSGSVRSFSFTASPRHT